MQSVQASPVPAGLHPRNRRAAKLGGRTEWPPLLGGSSLAGFMRDQVSMPRSSTQTARLPGLPLPRLPPCACARLALLSSLRTVLSGRPSQTRPWAARVPPLPCAASLPPDSHAWGAIHAAQASLTQLSAS